MTEEELQKKVDSFRWYHPIEVAPGVHTKPESQFLEVWKLIEDGMAKIDFKGKCVIDIGARDGKYSFMAEKGGASSVYALDNNGSPGAEFLKEFWKSKIILSEKNLYDLNNPNLADIVLFFGVLYHLRYPFQALRKLADALVMGGKIYIESGMLDSNHDDPMLYCPVRNSPYEITSCTFFNTNALRETLWAFGVDIDDVAVHPNEDGRRIRRMFISATKNREPEPKLIAYWEGVHDSHN